MFLSLWVILENLIYFLIPHTFLTTDVEKYILSYSAKASGNENMDTYYITRPKNPFVSLPQRMIAAFRQLEAQSPNSILRSVYVYDLVVRCTLRASHSIGEMLGYTGEQIHTMGANGLANLIHPDDLDTVDQHYQRFHTLKSGEVIVISYRVCKPNGLWCWLRSQATPLVMANDGLPLQILGMIQRDPE
jgi:PAS domain-containing protein